MVRTRIWRTVNRNFSPRGTGASGPMGAAARVPWADLARTHFRAALCSCEHPVAKPVPDGPPTSSPSVRSLPVRVVVGARRASPSARRERARIPPSPPISSFVPFHQQVERLSVGKRKSSAVKTCSSIARFPANAAVRLDLAICREFRPFSRVLKSFPPWR
jgi:hypothetical protein